VTLNGEKKMVRCKFRCESKTENKNNNGYDLVLVPVSCGSEENKNFFNYTPYGELRFGTVNKEAAKQIEIGKEYYIDITPVI